MDEQILLIGATVGAFILTGIVLRNSTMLIDKQHTEQNKQHLYARHSQAHNKLTGNGAQFAPMIDRKLNVPEPRFSVPDRNPFPRHIPREALGEDGKARAADAAAKKMAVPRIVRAGHVSNPSLDTVRVLASLNTPVQ